jgi:hypothetical protein
LAVIFNGYPRLTLDADILVHDRPDNLRRLLDCLAGWGEGWARELKPEDFAAQEGSIRVMEEFDLDIFMRMRGKALDDFRPRLRYLDTGSARILYLSPVKAGIDKVLSDWVVASYRKQRHGFHELSLITGVNPWQFVKSVSPRGQ